MLILPIVLSSLQIEANNIQDKVQGSYESPILITKNDFAPTQNKYDSNAITTTTFTGTRNVTAFIGPDAAFELINSTLYQATTSIYLEVYTLSSQALVDALIDMNNTGVEVIVLLSEYRVSGIETDYTQRAATQLDSNGIAVWWVERDYYYFTHAKFWIIDHEITFVYSGNWAPSSIPVDNSARENREMGFMFTDTEIATYYENVFFDDLFISFPFTGTYTGSLQSEDSGTYTHPFDTPQTFVENMEITPIFSPDNSYTLIHDLLESATTSIDVELQYIKFDCAFHTDLVNAAKRGVDVRVIIPEPGRANENVTELFLTRSV
jgi:phosphatidylserine/phosphatidylglycerophosphate/cardiolipin synthase-like enzyme